MATPDRRSLGGAPPSAAGGPPTPAADAHSEAGASPQRALPSHQPAEEVLGSAALGAAAPPPLAGETKEWLPVNGHQAGAAPGPTENKKMRQQLTSILGISISQARCAGHLKRVLHDPKAADRLQAIREELKRADPERADALKAEMARLSAATVRLSSDTSIAVAVLWDTALKELLRHGLAQAKGAGSRGTMMGVSHLHAPSTAGLTCYPLYSTLPAYSSYNPAAEEARQKERAAAGKAAREAKQAAPARPADAAAGAAGAADESPKTSFHTYVENALRDVKKSTEGCASTRTSAALRDHAAQLVADGIHRLAMLAQILAVQVVGARTVTSDNIKAIVQLLLTDAGRSPEEIDGVIGRIDEKLRLHQEHVAAEKERKAGLLSPEQRALAAKKAEDAERERRKRQLLSAQRQAEKAAKKAASLAGTAAT